MKKSYCFRKVFIVLLVLFCFISSTTNVFAMNNIDANELTSSRTTSFTDEFVLNSNSDTAVVTLNQEVRAGTTNKKYQVVKTGSNCVVIVRFVNIANSNRYTMALTADGGMYTENIGVTIPRGTYNVSFASTPCTVRYCWCVFEY